MENIEPPQMKLGSSSSIVNKSKIRELRSINYKTNGRIIRQPTKILKEAFLRKSTVSKDQGEIGSDFSFANSSDFESYSSSNSEEQNDSSIQRLKTIKFTKSGNKLLPQTSNFCNRLDYQDPDYIENTILYDSSSSSDYFKLKKADSLKYHVMSSQSASYNAAPIKKQKSTSSQLKKGPELDSGDTSEIHLNSQQLNFNDDSLYSLNIDSDSTSRVSSNKIISKTTTYQKSPKLTDGRRSFEFLEISDEEESFLKQLSRQKNWQQTTADIIIKSTTSKENFSHDSPSSLDSSLQAQMAQSSPSSMLETNEKLQGITSCDRDSKSLSTRQDSDQGTKLDSSQAHQQPNISTLNPNLDQNDQVSTELQKRAKNENLETLPTPERINQPALLSQIDVSNEGLKQSLSAAISNQASVKPQESDKNSNCQIATFNNPSNLNSVKSDEAFADSNPEDLMLKEPETQNISFDDSVSGSEKLAEDDNKQAQADFFQVTEMGRQNQPNQDESIGCEVNEIIDSELLDFKPTPIIYSSESNLEPFSLEKVPSSDVPALKDQGCVSGLNSSLIDESSVADSEANGGILQHIDSLNNANANKALETKGLEIIRLPLNSAENLPKAGDADSYENGDAATKNALSSKFLKEHFPPNAELNSSTLETRAKVINPPAKLISETPAQSPKILRNGSLMYSVLNDNDKKKEYEKDISPFYTQKKPYRPLPTIPGQNSNMRAGLPNFEPVGGEGPRGNPSNTSLHINLDVSHTNSVNYSSVGYKRAFRKPLPIPPVRNQAPKKEPVAQLFGSESQVYTLAGNSSNSNLSQSGAVSPMPQPSSYPDKPLALPTQNSHTNNDTNNSDVDSPLESLFPDLLTRKKSYKLPSTPRPKINIQRYKNLEYEIPGPSSNTIDLLENVKLSTNKNPPKAELLGSQSNLILSEVTHVNTNQAENPEKIDHTLLPANRSKKANISAPDNADCPSLAASDGPISKEHGAISTVLVSNLSTPGLSANGSKHIKDASQNSDAADLNYISDTFSVFDSKLPSTSNSIFDASVSFGSLPEQKTDTLKESIQGLAVNEAGSSFDGNTTFIQPGMKNGNENQAGNSESRQTPSGEFTSSLSQNDKATERPEILNKTTSISKKQPADKMVTIGTMGNYFDDLDFNTGDFESLDSVLTFEDVNGFINFQDLDLSLQPKNVSDPGTSKSDYLLPSIGKLKTADDTCLAENSSYGPTSVKSSSPGSRSNSYLKTKHLSIDKVSKSHHGRLSYHGNSPTIAGTGYVGLNMEETTYLSYGPKNCETVLQSSLKSSRFPSSPVQHAQSNPITSSNKAAIDVTASYTDISPSRIAKIEQVSRLTQPVTPLLPTNNMIISGFQHNEARCSPSDTEQTTKSIDSTCVSQFDNHAKPVNGDFSQFQSSKYNIDELKRMRARRNAIKELYSTELSYSRDLGILLDVFYRRISELNDPGITNRLFGNIHIVAMISARTCSTIDALLEPVKSFNEMVALEKAKAQSMKEEETRARILKEEEERAKAQLLKEEEEQAKIATKRITNINKFIPKLGNKSDLKNVNVHPAYQGSYQPKRFVPALTTNKRGQNKIQRRISSQIDRTNDLHRITSDSTDNKKYSLDISRLTPQNSKNSRSPALGHSPSRNNEDNSLCSKTRYLSSADSPDHLNHTTGSSNSQSIDRNISTSTQASMDSLNSQPSEEELICLSIYDSLLIGISYKEVLSELSEAMTIYSRNYKKAIQFLSIARSKTSSQKDALSSYRTKNFNLLIRTISDGQKDVSTRRLDFESFLMLPIQRLTKVPLILRTILKSTLSSNNDYLELSESIFEIELLLSKINQVIEVPGSDTQFEGVRDRLSSLFDHSSVFDLSGDTLVLGKRKFIHEGTLFKRLSNRQLYAFLFNDILLLTTPTIKASKISYSLYCPPIELCDIVLRVKLGDSLTSFSGFESFDIYQINKQKSINLRASSPEAAKLWVDVISSASDKAYEAIYNNISEGIHVGSRKSIYSKEHRRIAKNGY